MPRPGLPAPSGDEESVFVPIELPSTNTSSVTVVVPDAVILTV